MTAAHIGAWPQLVLAIFVLLFIVLAALDPEPPCDTLTIVTTRAQSEQNGRLNGHRASLLRTCGDGAHPENTVA